MDTIIKVENLSKKYIIGHQQLSGKKTFRDAIAQSIIGFKSKFKHSFSKNFSHDSLLEEFWALRDINFEVKQGDRIGIIGRNGAGKSTLLKILSRITEPSTGKITIKGRVASLLEVGTGFSSELSGRENIFLNGAILGMHRTEIKQKFDEIVDFSGVEKFLDTPVKRYSSGMYVRLAFAIAAHLEPEILIVDEVLAVGDAEFQKKCLGKMSEVSKEGGRTVLFVSHNMTAVNSLCNRGIYLLNGKIHDVGKVEDVISKYLSKSKKKSHVIFDGNAENEFIKINTIELLNNSDGYFKIDEPQRIQVNLKNKNIEDLINVNLYFNTFEGGLIFASVSEIKKIPIGGFICICNIPANFLNDTSYFLDIMVVKNGEIPLMHLKNIMLIEGIEPIRETAWFGKFPGLIRPKLNWEFKF